MNYANPIYDTAFKWLIRDKEIAKEIIGTLLQTEVVDVELKITEWNKPVSESDAVPRSVRLDYCATILDEKGEQKKILIEIQKTSKPEDIFRFRQYLAIAGYGDKSETTKSALPIVTFYFLGFKLENINTPCLKVARQYFDMIEEKVLDTKEKFVELLTHDSYIIQIPLIKNEDKPHTKLEKILSIFEQNLEKSPNHMTLFYRFPIEDEYIRMMLGKLHYVIAEPAEKKELENEDYWLRDDDFKYGALMRKDQEIAELKKKHLESAKAFKKLNVSIEEISQLTGLSLDEIERL
jgi:predicted transposase/invertase (TIGR01784 family)